MADKKYTIPDEKIYSKEELELFKALEDDIDNSSYEPLKADELEKEKSEASQIAKNTISRISRKKSLNLRVYENDIQSIKAIALQKGLPYQTFLSSIIHQVATKQIEV
jgi:predicted DNA binding CopG/RHH family protein